MKPSDWDRMMDREDTDIEFLMGQREAARLLLQIATRGIDAARRELWVTAARTVYEEQRAKPDSSRYFEVMGSGFLEFCRLFLENREWDDEIDDTPGDSS